MALFPGLGKLRVFAAESRTLEFGVELGIWNSPRDPTT